MAQSLNLTEMGKVLKLSAARIHQLCSQGIIPRNSDGTIHMIKGIHAYIDYMRENMVAHTKGSMSLSEAKQRRAIAQAKLLELELQLQEGEVVKVIDVQPQWERLITACKNKLQAIPSKTAPLLVSQENLAYINNILEEQITEALNELAKGENIDIVEEEVEPEFSEDDQGGDELLSSTSEDGD